MQILTVAIRVIQQVIKDKRTLLFLLLAPVFVLGLLYVIMGSSSDEPNIGIIDLERSLQESLEAEAHIIEFPSEEEALQAMKTQDIDAYFYMEANTPYIEIEGGDITKKSPVMQAIQSSLQTFQKERAEEMKEDFEVMQDELAIVLKNMQQQTGQSIPIDFSEVDLLMEEPEINYLYLDENADLFDQVAPALMGFFIFLFVFLIAGISFLRERTSGTLERTLATPLKRSSIVFGYFLGFFLFVTIQTVIIQIMIVDILHVDRLGSYWLLLFMNIIVATVALSLGLLLSTFARTEFQLLQFIPVAVITQFFFSGIFDLSNAPGWVMFISKIMPLSYATDALQNVMIRGYDFSDIANDFIVLIGFTIVFILLNMLVLKRQRAA
ncbi:ABC transporter permease [Oceanobacillus indicireducens]|uniref:ABC transporter permease n=1 Tax=Oceanobacillus indicireducens TaxID=1004261 RepID=A0A917Y296_9BACI|nr:ABC transporter permease [Oceanobacillus indicireducens]GGN62388.1 ABC transporter permease [Oceanobacillus indicireducens]